MIYHADKSMRGVRVVISKKPPKIGDVVGEVKRLLDLSAYVFTGHARVRLNQREVTALEAIYVLKNGQRKAARDRFDEVDQNGVRVDRWSYALEGKTLDKRRLRIAISFKEANSRTELMLIVTVIDLDRGD
jgi:hypothetical protein